MKEKRLWLEFGKDSEDLREDLSAVILTRKDEDSYHIWLGCDEAYADDHNTLDRVSFDLKAWQTSDHQAFRLQDLLQGFDDGNGEVDIEGLDTDPPYLWLVGSHSTKRKKVKHDPTAEDLQFSRNKIETNRYLLARIPLNPEGDPVPAYEDFQQIYRAAHLRYRDGGNALLDELQGDAYIGDILRIGLPSKDNGFDIEGLAVRQGEVWLGLRGPVLRGVAILIRIRPVDSVACPGILELAPFEDGYRYKRHFVQLEGLGIRDLCFEGDDLLILAGPTMDADGPQRLFRLSDPAELKDSSVSRLEPILEIPYVNGADRAEGLAVFSRGGKGSAAESLMVIYDSPTEDRMEGPAQQGIWADVLEKP